MAYYTDEQFNEIVELRRKWLNSYEDAQERHRLAHAIDEIEYRDYSVEQIESIRNRRRQVASYVKMRIACPNVPISTDDYITEEPLLSGNPPKILFGVMELANVAATLCKEFRSQKIEAYCLDYYKHPFKYATDLSREQLDFSSERLTMLNFVSELIAEFDVFNFFFTTTLLYGLDLPVYRELDKKVIMHYSGGEVRLYSLAARENAYLTLVEDTYFANYGNQDLQNLHNLIVQSNYAHAAVAYNNEFIGQVKLAFSEYFEIPQPLVLSDFAYEEPRVGEREAGGKFTIVHAPSNTHIKGSHYIAEAIDALKKLYDFEFISIVRIPYDEAMEVYKKADLIIDQLLIGWHGILSLEAMALGKPVICYLGDRFYEQPHTKECPLINATIHTIYEKLEWALNNRSELVEIGRRGREYVEANHDSAKIAVQYLATYNSVPLMNPSNINFYKRHDVQSVSDAMAGVAHLDKMGNTISEFLIASSYKRIGVFGNEQDELTRLFISIGYEMDITIKTFVPERGNQEFDMVVLTMESNLIESYQIANAKCPSALIVTINELILLVS